VLVDTTGAGEPIYENLRRAGIRAQPYSFTAKSKAALVDNLSLVFEKRGLVLPRPDLWPEGIDELEGFQYSVSDSGNVRSGAPSGCHDDCVMALALAAWQRRNQGCTGIQIAISPPGRRLGEGIFPDQGPRGGDVRGPW
jgi:hypothetical protein